MVLSNGKDRVQIQFCRHIWPSFWWYHPPHQFCCAEYSHKSDAVATAIGRPSQLVFPKKHADVISEVLVTSDKFSMI